MEFTSTGFSEPSKKTSLFNLRTGEPFEIKPKDIHGRTRDVSEFEKLNRVGEGTYGVVFKVTVRNSDIPLNFFRHSLSLQTFPDFLMF